MLMSEMKKEKAFAEIKTLNMEYIKGMRNLLKNFKVDDADDEILLEISTILQDAKKCIMEAI